MKKILNPPDYVFLGMVGALVLFGLIALASNARADSLIDRVKGRILLQVQEHGEAWYVNPADNKRFYLGRPADAFQIMRELGLGITNADLAQIPQAGDTSTGNLTLRQRLKGKILLQTEEHGEAWYVFPINLQRYYLGRPADAFQIMRNLGLGITNQNLEKITQSFLHPVSSVTPVSSIIPTPSLSREVVADRDSDGIVDVQDNCPTLTNPDQKNTDQETRQPNSGQILVRDTQGDACDFDDFIQGSNETGVDCGGLSPFACVSCNWCERNNLEPLRVRGGKDKIDVAFLPAQDYFSSSSDPRFRERVMFLLRYVYFHQVENYINASIFSSTKGKVGFTLPADYKERFNFYLYKGTGLADRNRDRYLIGLAAGLPTDYASARSFIDVTHILSYSQGSPGGETEVGTPGIMYTEPWGTSAIHELTHLLFRVQHNGDTANGINGWATLEECRQFARLNGWPDLCHARDNTGTMMYDCYLDGGQICVVGNHGYIRSPEIDLTTSASTPIMFGPAESRQVYEVFSNWAKYDSLDPIP